MKNLFSIVLIIIAFGCRKEQLIPIKYVGSEIWANKSSGEKAKEVNIYRSDPMDPSKKAIYWLQTSSLRNGKLVPHVDCGITSSFIFNRASFKWINDSTLLLNLLNSHKERYKVIKNGNRFSITEDRRNKDSAKVLFMEAIPIIPNKTVKERED
jgi:hypothetical protein